MMTVAELVALALSGVPVEEFERTYAEWVASMRAERHREPGRVLSSRQQLLTDLIIAGQMHPKVAGQLEHYQDLVRASLKLEPTD